MTRALAALGCGLVFGSALFAVIGVAFWYGIGPAEHLIDHDPIHPF